MLTHYVILFCAATLLEPLPLRLSLRGKLLICILIVWIYTYYMYHAHIVVRRHAEPAIIDSALRGRQDTPSTAAITEASSAGSLQSNIATAADTYRQTPVSLRYADTLMYIL